MSYYQQGLATTCYASQKQVYRSGLYEPRQTSIGALIATPGAIRDEVQRLNVEVQTFAREVADSRAVGKEVTPEQEAWHNAVFWPFLAGWDAWFHDHGEQSGLSNWWHNFWGSAWDDAQKWRQKLIDVRNSAPLTLISPAPAPPQKGWGSSAISELWSMVKVLVWAGVLIGGGILLFRFMGR